MIGAQFKLVWGEDLKASAMRGCSVHYHETLDLTDSVDVKLIDPPRIAIRGYQEDIEDLVSSIREKGVIQPIVVRPTGARFEVVAGARRLEACRRLRWAKVPCIIRELSDQDAFEISLTENIQRKTMNPMEEALAFKRYIEQAGWGGESQLAKKIGKSQEFVSQRLALLNLPKSVQTKIIRRQINPSVAQEIARLEDPSAQEILSEHASLRKLTVGVVRESASSIRKGEDVERAIREAQERRRRVGALSIGASHSQVAEDLSEPEFIRQSPRDHLESQDISAVSELEKASLILRLALSRLGTLIDEISEESPVKELLLEKRLIIHDMIDSLIKSKIKIRSRTQAPFT